MKKGDWVFFYHSVTEKQIVGVAKVDREAYPDPTAKEGDWATVDLVPFKPLKSPVPLEALKTDPQLKDMALLRQTRLSVTPISPEQCDRLLTLSQTKL
jgi:predicted RNA-binding protein with PUA-like domain